MQSPARGSHPSRMANLPIRKAFRLLHIYWQLVSYVAGSSFLSCQHLGSWHTKG